MKRPHLLTLSALFCAVLGFGATFHSHWDHVPAKDHARSNPLAGRPQAINAGALVYADHCAQCHRADARGDGKHPSLRGGNLGMATDGDIEWFLRQGDLAHGMPSWSSLPTEQRWQLVAYLRSIQ
jgi:mono/diheme cytochrome c family protein